MSGHEGYQRRDAEHRGVTHHVAHRVALEQPEREDNGKREAKAATGNELFLPPNANANGKAASKFAMPNWNDLRGLTPEERRLVLDYFKRINAEKP